MKFSSQWSEFKFFIIWFLNIQNCSGNLCLLCVTQSYRNLRVYTLIHKLWSNCENRLSFCFQLSTCVVRYCVWQSWLLTHMSSTVWITWMHSNCQMVFSTFLHMLVNSQECIATSTNSWDRYGCARILSTWSTIVLILWVLNRVVCCDSVELVMKRNEAFVISNKVLFWMGHCKLLKNKVVSVSEMIVSDPNNISTAGHLLLS